jgi:hypothetical protein
MPQIEYIFCEGSADSLDRKVLEKVLEGLSPDTKTPKIVPAGGKGNLPNFMQGYLSRGGVGSNDINTAIGFRDRDFDAPVPNVPQLSSSRNPKIKLSYRATIENYLLSYDSLFRFIQEDREKYRMIGINSLDDARNVFEEEARSLKYYTASRHTLGVLRQAVNMNTTWTKGSGVLPNVLDRADCLQETIQLVENVKNTAQSLTNDAKTIVGATETTSVITNNYIEQIYDHFIARFNDNFIENQEYLIWYNGKDIQEAIKKRMPFRLQGFSFKNYYQYVLDSEQFNIQNFPDLIQLRNILNGTSSL